MTKAQKLNLFAWVLSGASALIAFIAWGQMVNWDFFMLSIYQVFPLLGLIAFSLMWAHYMVAGVRLYVGLPATVTKSYFESTSLVVLALILLHPGLLIFQLWKDGYGLPPNSYLSFVGPSLKWAVGLGSLSLLIFIAFEFRRKYKTRSWWKYVAYLNDAAILAIFIHSLKLGSRVQGTWLKNVWAFYGISLVVCLIYMYIKRYKRNASRKATA